MSRTIKWIIIFLATALVLTIIISATLLIRSNDEPGVPTPSIAETANAMAQSQVEELVKAQTDAFNSYATAAAAESKYFIDANATANAIAQEGKDNQQVANNAMETAVAQSTVAAETLASAQAISLTPIPTFAPVETENDNASNNDDETNTSSDDNTNANTSNTDAETTDEVVIIIWDHNQPGCFGPQCIDKFNETQFAATHTVFHIGHASEDTRGNFGDRVDLFVPKNETIFLAQNLIDSIRSLAGDAANVHILVNDDRILGKIVGALTEEFANEDGYEIDGFETGDKLLAYVGE